MSGLTHVIWAMSLTITQDKSFEILSALSTNYWTPTSVELRPERAYNVAGFFFQLENKVDRVHLLHDQDSERHFANIVNVKVYPERRERAFEILS